MTEKATLLTVYKLLPQTNCGECGEVNCMTFASSLLERKKTVKDCTPLFQDVKYKAQAAKLVELVAPPVREITLGVGERAVKIGGKQVMYRHDLTYHNPTAIAIDVSDKLGDAEIVERVTRAEKFQFTHIGEKLRLDAIAVRAASGDPQRFAQAVASVAKNSALPLILCSLDPAALRLAVEQKGVYERRPMLYAATKENWKDVGALAKQYSCPLVAFSPGDLSGLKALAKTLRAMGNEEIVLDPGLWTQGSLLKNSIENLEMLRRSAIQKEDKDLAYPIMAVPAVAWIGESLDPKAAAFTESYMAGLLLTRFADIVIMHSLEVWALLPVVTLRQGVYTDPRKPVAVETGLKAVGNPNEASPVLLTTNFALTYYTVANDLEAAGVTCHLLVLNTEGLSVESSVAGGQFNAAGVKDLVGSSNVESKTKHRKLVIPGMAARLSGEIEDLTKWEVMVGPKDSSQIKEYLDKFWNGAKTQ
jgi:acetyl-CoA decarbonylase/synthase complex subunit gamma